MKQLAEEAVPRTLVLLVGQRDVDHAHQGLFEEGPVGLPVVLLQDLPSPLRSHWQNQATAGLQLIQELPTADRERQYTRHNRVMSKAFICLV